MPNVTGDSFIELGCWGLQEMSEAAIPWVVLTGAANAGKSTLFNALLGRERAVVASIAGTTRDVLAEPLTITADHGPAEVMLVDLAGPVDDDSVLNRHMQAAAREAIERAELVIRCIPIDQPSEGPGGAEWIVRTKADLVDGDGSDKAGPISVSAVTGRGLEALRSAIAGRLGGRAVSLAGDALALRPRHETALRSAVRNLDEAIELIRPARAEHALPNPELIASAMRSALNELSALAGKVTPDDVLGRIFADFCVGK